MTQWILVAPTKTKLVLQCTSKNEVLVVTGTHLIRVPERCRFIFGNITIAQDKISDHSFTVIFNMNMDVPSSVKISEPSVALKQLELDSLKKFRTENANFP